jgi:hypothetical protein
VFVIFATKPLNDRTKGFRFNIFGLKGLTRKRKVKSLPWSIKTDDCMTAIHMGKRSIYFEHNATIRRLRHFAG